MFTYIVCLSNLSIPTVLSICADAEDFLIITDQPSICEFFNNIYGSSKVILVKKPPVYTGIKNIFARYFLKEYKLYLLGLLGKPQNAKIYFFYNAFGTYISWWLQLIARDNEIFYKPDLDISMWPVKYNSKSILNITALMVSYSVRCVPVWNGNQFFPKVSPGFLKKNNINVLTNIDINWEYIKSTIGKTFHIDSSPYLLLTGNNIVDHLIEEDEFIKKNDALINLLGPSKISVKVHPRFNFHYSKEKECNIIPNYIPANVIMNNFTVFIGYTSSVLFEAANMGKTAISLLDYFEPVSVDRRETYRVYLDENLIDKSNPIHFPKTLNDIEEILKLKQLI